MTKDEALTLALNALQINRRPHYYCENRWHSCPRHEEGCANDEDGDECNCGADKANAEIDTAIAAIKALAQSEQEPVLQDIEQYRLQMAGISTAAIGYWKEGDGIHPDYDTLALRDVAKLYSKYDELYKAQLEQEPVAWKLVPVEPTEGMLKAMDECSKEGYDERLYAGHAASVYMAAVDAAPTQPTAHRTAGGNFCPRCGKRAADIHTCTPPQ